MEDKEIVEQLINKGFNYIDYVPCSNLKGIKCFKSKLP